jgi:hypothetical protein
MYFKEMHKAKSIKKIIARQNFRPNFWGSRSPVDSLSAYKRLSPIEPNRGA